MVTLGVQEGVILHSRCTLTMEIAEVQTGKQGIVTRSTMLCHVLSDFRITPVKSGFNTVRLHWSKTGICSVLTLGASLGLIIFTVLIRKSEKQWKVLRDCLKNLPTGIPSGHQTFPRGCAPRESLMTLGNSLGQIFPDNPYGLSTVCPRF